MVVHIRDTALLQVRGNGPVDDSERRAGQRAPAGIKRFEERRVVALDQLIEKCRLPTMALVARSRGQRLKARLMKSSRRTARPSVSCQAFIASRSLSLRNGKP